MRTTRKILPVTESGEKNWGKMLMSWWLCNTDTQRRKQAARWNYEMDVKTKFLLLYWIDFCFICSPFNTKIYVYTYVYNRIIKPVLNWTMRRVCVHTHRAVAQVSHVAGVAEQLSKHVRSGLFSALQHLYCLVTAALETHTTITSLSQWINAHHKQTKAWIDTRFWWTKLCRI